MRLRNFERVFAICSSEGRKMDYKVEIIQLLNGTDNVKFLEFLYLFTKRLKENWGL